MERNIETRSNPDASPADLRERRRIGDLAHIAVARMGGVDARVLALALVGGAGYFALATLCLALSRFDTAFASIWLPNACAVALLLLARLRNGVAAHAVFGAAFAAACIAANWWGGTALETALHFAIANCVEILLVTWLIRRSCGVRPDLTDLGDLGKFLQYGGFAGPLVGALIAAPALGSDQASIWTGAAGWLLADALGMILVVPAALLIADAWRNPAVRLHARSAESAVLMTGGLLAVYVVFRQDIYPLLFLVPPVTLLLAFRLGALGTAIYVPAVAIMASALTYSGVGPIVNNSTSELSQTYLIQAFSAVNYLTGLPIAAILAGRSQMTLELIKGKREVALLTENITDAVLRIDQHGVCTYASPSVLDVLGRTPEDFVGNHVMARIHPETQDRIAETLERLLNRVSIKERLCYRRLLDSHEGSPVFIEADCAAVIDPETGKHDGIVVSARDVTDRVELELLLTRARSRAENAANAKTEFLANMSHEIRTPMNGVLGFAELMLQGDLDDANRRYAEMIVQSGRSMMLLLNDILDLSKIEAGQIAIDHGPVDLLATIAECASLHRAAAERKGLALEFGGSAEGGRPDGDRYRHPWIRTDGLRLRQIVLNLIGNAVKFTQEGRVHVACTADAEAIVIEVSDTGVGIGPDRLEAIFAPFTQGENDTARRFGGTGLGLTISRQLAGLLGGTIDVRSEPGKGSTFRLALPAIYTEPVERSARRQEAIAPADLPQSGRVLLVEDHDVNRMLASEMLERCGQRVAIAHDGNEAIAMVIDSVVRGNPYDLVLMDIQMPGCDGYAATRAIRADGIGPDTLPIVALTANAFPEDIAAARKSGMQAHLTKPLVFSDLARTLQRWLPTRIVEDAGEREDAGPQAAPVMEAARGASSSPQPHGRMSASPALMQRWNQRRSEAIEAVREALQRGHLASDTLMQERSEPLARIVHKLAGTAAMFGEAELGDQAAEFERALRTGLEPEVILRMASHLLDVADGPADFYEATGT